MIRIAIADDHALMRAGVRQIIEGTDDMEVVGEVSQGYEVMHLVRNGGFDVLLLDLALSGANGVDLIARVREERRHLPVLVLSMHCEARFVSRALKAGAYGYVTKFSEPTVLLSAIRKLAAGDRFIDPCLVNQLVFENVEETERPHHGLSSREFHVLQLFAQGKNAVQMAKDLQLSTKTISTHKSHIKEKLGLQTDVDLLRYAIEHRVA